LPDAPGSKTIIHQIMKSFYSVALVAVLFAGCSAKENQPAATPSATPTPSAPSAAAAYPNTPGGAFLTANAKKDRVITTASGLQYKILSSGTGATPKATDTVKVDYQGTLIDGTIFDSSIQRGTPATFPVNGVISGWVEALQLMKVGDKWQVFVPANLAYGEQSPSPQIPPNSVLIFEVDLLDIVK
jgi:FKBP-type peptidyl-prolyl cis-trans isomerase